MVVCWAVGANHVIILWEEFAVGPVCQSILQSVQLADVVVLQFQVSEEAPRLDCFAKKRNKTEYTALHTVQWKVARLQPFGKKTVSAQIAMEGDQGRH
jgi:hypothetical protein